MKDIDESRITLSQLRTIVEVAKSGNFSEAALRLELSPSAVSHAIANLEAELGVILFTRGRHGAYPTSIGDRVVAHAHQVLQQLGKLVKDVNLEKRLQSGQVRIACFRTVATHLLPTVISRFHDRCPNIVVTIEEHWDYVGVEQSLRSGRADIGFTQLPTGDEFEAWELLRDEYIALLPPHPSITTETLTWEQLGHYPLIFPSDGGNCYTLIHKHLTHCSFPLKIAYDVKESSTMVSMAMQGLGAAILARLSAEPIPSDVQVFSLPVPLERVIGVAMLAGALQPPAVFALLDLLKTTEFGAIAPHAIKQSFQFKQ